MAEDGPAPMLLEPGGRIAFPDPEVFDEHGLVAFGGDLSVDRLLFAYANGIFPWFDDDSPPLWWSPNPRCVLPLDELHVPRRLERRMRRKDYRLTVDTAFEQVMRACAEGRDDGTWITDWMVAAYGALHAAGYASSLEVWQEDRLVGGIYGVRIGGLFAGESMFMRATDMSKIALVSLARLLRQVGCRLFDVQFRTEHLGQFGCVELERALYRARAREACEAAVDWPVPGPLPSSGPSPGCANASPPA